VPDVLSATGVFSFPDPRRWPRSAVRSFQQATGSRSLFDISVFMHGQVAALHMEDAIAGLSVLPVSPQQWHTHMGYPVLTFDPSKLAEYKAKFRAAGYRVVVLEPMTGEWQHKVVDIASAREKFARRRKWA
jgi:hypothetical protein